VEGIIRAKFTGIFRASLHYRKSSLRLDLLRYISVEVVLGHQLRTFTSQR